MRRRDLALSYCRAGPLQQMIMKVIKQLNVSFYLKPTKIVVIKINEIKIFLSAQDEKLWSQNLFIDIWAHMPMHYAICIYGSVSAGRGKRLFRVLFFWKVEPSCCKTWHSRVYFSIVSSKLGLVDQKITSWPSVMIFYMIFI